MKNKLINIKLKIDEVLKPYLLKIDEKVNTAIPNPKTKKVLYITVSSLFGFMVLIIILGIIISPLRNNNQGTIDPFKKPKVITQKQTPEPARELNKTEKDLLDLENKIINLTFPESRLNIPVIERNISL